MYINTYIHMFITRTRAYIYICMRVYVPDNIVLIQSVQLAIFRLQPIPIIYAYTHKQYIYYA